MNKHSMSYPNISGNFYVHDLSNIVSDNEGQTQSIYDNPTSLRIRVNISYKKFDILNKYHDMGFIASIADNLFVLPTPIKSYLHCNYIHASEKYESDKKVFESNFEKNIKASKKLDKRVSHKKALFESISKVYPNFCCNMEEKIGKEKYALYISQKQAFLKATNHNLDSSSADFDAELLDYNDRLSRVIDTPKFSEACCIEDEFVISEVETFLQTLSNMPKESQRPFHRKKIKIGEEHFSTVELAEKMKAERMARLEKYDEIKKLYKKLEKHPYIKLSGKDKEER